MNVIKFWQQTSLLIRLVNQVITCSFPNSKNFRLVPTFRRMRAFSRPNTSFYCYKGDNFTVDHWGENKSQSSSWNKVYLRIIIFQGSLNKSRFFCLTMFQSLLQRHCLSLILEFISSVYLITLCDKKWLFESKNLLSCPSKLPKKWVCWRWVVYPGHGIEKCKYWCLISQKRHSTLILDLFLLTFFKTFCHFRLSFYRTSIRLLTFSLPILINKSTNSTVKL